MAKRKSSRIYPNGTKFIRDAVPTPKDVASFVAPSCYSIPRKSLP